MIANDFYTQNEITAEQYGDALADYDLQEQASALVSQSLYAELIALASYPNDVKTHHYTLILRVLAEHEYELAAAQSAPASLVRYYRFDDWHDALSAYTQAGYNVLSETYPDV